MTAYLAPQFDTQFFDGSNVAAGYKLYTYDSGTTTPKAVYSDQAGTVPHTNPIVLDANGRVTGQMFLGSGEYTFTLKTSADVLVKAWNDVAGSGTANEAAAYDSAIRADLASTSDASKGAGMVGFIQSGAGAVSRTVQNKQLEHISPSDFGVKADGSTDDWAAWAAFFTEYAARVVTISGASGFGGTSSFSAPKVVCTLTGTSLLSKPLVLPPYLNIELSNVMFNRHPSWSEPAGTYLVTSTGIYQASFGGLSFRGVQYALELKNPNLDQTVIHVAGVRFAGGDHALRVECKSASVVVSDFKSDRVPHFLLNEACDNLKLKDGWISQGSLTAAKDATITNNADLIVENVLGVPIAHTGAEVAWINNYAHCDIRRMRFGGEPGSCTAINNFATANTTYPVSPTSVQLVDCQTYSTDTQGGAQQSCIVRLFALPNILRIRENRGAIDTNRLVAWGSTADQTAELAKADFCVLDVDKNQYRLNGVPFPDNLDSLLDTSGRKKLVVTSTSANTAVCDTSIVPTSGKTFDIILTGNPRAGGSTLYLSAWRGIVTAVTGFNGSAIVRRLVVTPLQQANGGQSFGYPFTVTATFWDGSSALTEVSAANTTATLRLSITGWETGNEGASLKGYLLEATPA